MFEEMFQAAADKLAAVTERVDGLPAPQVTVLLTNNDTIYVAVNDVDGAICEELKQDKNTKIVRMLTMWKEGRIDVPSFRFRKALVSLDEENNNTDVILQGTDGYVMKKLAGTIP